MIPRHSLLAVALLVASGAVDAQTAPPTVEQLAERLRVLEQRLGVGATPEPVTDAAGLAALDQRLRVIERQLELQAEDAATKAATASTVQLSPKGLSLRSPAADGIEVKVRALVQADGRTWIDDDRLPQNDGFLLRRVQPALEGTWGKLVGYRIMAELAGDSASIADAYVDLKFDPRATLRAGKFKVPFGIERLQSSGATTFVELGLPSELAPNRDLGVQLQGEFGGGRLAYAVGAFNGAADGRDGASQNADDGVEAFARVAWEPFRDAANAASGLGFALAASHGDATGTATLPRYRTPGQVNAFGYRATVVADGERARLSPQVTYYQGPLGVLAEAVASRQAVRTGTAAADLEHRAWQVAASWVLTGEDASYRGVVRPDRAFGADGGGLGAFELAARVGVLDIDDGAFPVFADPASAVRRTRAWTVGLNWYLTQNFKLVANYTQAAFEGGAPTGADREDEKTLFTRAQFAF
ncbi:OprO/OprP family phosphate-selective porin [Lysobacter humi (ex Lee et al. 2017)]